MSQFEYIAVLISVIAGLGIVHLLRGVARFFTDRERFRPYWVHVVWTWNLFHFIVFFWWFTWRWTVVEQWQLLLYFFLLIYATCLYLLCAIVYPPEREGTTDFRSIYFNNRKVFFGLWIVIILVDIVDTRWKMSVGLSGLGPLHVVTWTIVIAGSALAMQVRNHVYHAAWALVFLVLLTYMEFSTFGVLRAD